MKDNDFKLKQKIVFDDNELGNFAYNLDSSFDKKQFNFVEHSFRIWQLKKYCEKKYNLKRKEISYQFLDSGLSIAKVGKFSFYAMCKECFGLDFSTITRSIAILERFTNLKNYEHYTVVKDDLPVLDPKYENFTKSKLQELLPLTDSQIDNLFCLFLTFKSTVSEIRSMVKDKTKPLKIPAPVFDFDKLNYSLNDFRLYSRSELSIIAYQLYSMHVKNLKGKGVKK